MGNTPCGLLVFMGSVAGKFGSRAKDVGLGGRHGVAEVIRRHAVGVKAGIGEGSQGDFGDRRIGIARREGVDDPSLPEIACLTIAVESGVFEVGIEFGEDLGDKDRVVGDVAGAPIRDRNGGGSTAHLHGPVEDRVKRIAGDEDRYGARGMVSHIEQRAVRRQGAASRLGESLDRRRYPAPHEINDRDGTADTVGHVRHPVGRMDSYAAGLLANADFDQLCGDIIAIRIFHSND